jgi:hypothetical protein
MAVGMSVPGASDLGLFGPASLTAPLSGESEEQRRKRLLAQQQQKLLPNTGVGASALMGTYGVAGALGGM